MPTTHADEEQLQRLLHDELTPSQLAAVREHLAGCAECRRRFATAERDELEVYTLLRQVDHPTPRVSVEAIRARALTRRVPWSRWAAGILLVLGAGAAYAAPGSPLPRWLKVVAQWAGGGPDPSPTPQAPSASGVAVAPGPELVILFTSPQSEGGARVVLTDGAEVQVRAAAGAATFTVDVNRLVVDNRGSSGNFEIQVPRSAPRVEIRIGQARIFLKDGSRVTADGLMSTPDSYLLRLAPSPP